MKYFIAIVIIPIIAFIIFIKTCDFIEIQSSTTTAIMFEYLISSKYKNNILNLQGGGQTWQGYCIYMRFQADKNTLDQLFTEGYNEVEWQDIKDRFSADQASSVIEGTTTFIDFNPKWDTGNIKSQKCLYWSGSNDWTHAGEHYVVIDTEKLIVYFCAFGV